MRQKVAKHVIWLGKTRGIAMNLYTLTLTTTSLTPPPKGMGHPRPPQWGVSERSDISESGVGRGHVSPKTHILSYDSLGKRGNIYFIIQTSENEVQQTISGWVRLCIHSVTRKIVLLNA